MLNVSQHLQENTFTGVSFLINISCGMPLKPIFIQKEVPTLVFSWQLSEIFNNNFFKERKKALLCEKKHCYKKRRSDIYRRSNYATFYVTSPILLYFSKDLAQFIVTTGNFLCNFAKITVFQQGFSTVHSDNRLYIVLSVEKNHWK